MKLRTCNVLGEMKLILYLVRLRPRILRHRAPHRLVVLTSFFHCFYLRIPDVPKQFEDDGGEVREEDEAEELFFQILLGFTVRE